MLCYVKTVNWGTLLAENYRTLGITHMNKEPGECPSCPARCQNGNSTYCWNMEHCQRMIEPHCHEECVKGCDGPANHQCHVCKNLSDGKKCVSKCPANKYLLQHLARCVTKDVCDSLNGTWWTFKNECINNCPTKYKFLSPKEGNYTCEYCGKDCPKYCTGAQVESVSAAQQLKGCTHIKGSLNIRIEGPRSIDDELEQNLGMIEEIEGYLKVHRSFSLRSLNFLKKLRVINGNNLESNFSVIVHDNQNLQELWNWTSRNSPVIIKNGTFKFHYNPKLCMSEIEKLYKQSGLKINYSNIDVSPHSNGDKFACNFINITTKVNLTGPNDVNLTWDTGAVPDKESLIGYLVYYIEAPYQNVSAYDGDACGDQGWRTIFVQESNSTILNQSINNLEPFTQYAYYISTAYDTGKSQSQLKYFKTLSSDPTGPRNIQAFPAGSDSLLVVWDPPKTLNGVLSHYIMLADLQEDNRSSLDLRNYCSLPLKETNLKSVPKKIITTTTTTIAPVNKNSTCTCKDIKETVIPKIEIDFDAICTDLEKYGDTDDGDFHGCGSFSYQVLQSASDDRISTDNPSLYKEESSAENMIELRKRHKSGMKRNSGTNHEDILVEGKYHRVTKEINGNATSFTLDHLEHYSIYILWLAACNKNRTEKPQCSPVVRLSQRTGRSSSADDINTPGVKLKGTNSVEITWFEPEQPNSVIVSYIVEYRSVDRENHKYVADCITRIEHEKANFKYTIVHLQPGNYTLRIKAQSLAGDGSYTKNVYFYIPIPSSNNTVTHVVVSVVMVLLVIFGVAFYFWYRKKHQLDNVHLITTCNPDYVGYVEDEWEMDRDNVKLLNELGQGTFGTVYQGLIKDRQIPCAIKTVHEKADLHDKMEFLNEASVMKSFNEAHHVVRLLGVVSRGVRPLVVMELMGRGDLKTFLRSTRDSSTCLTCSEMYRMAAEIADGMAYLSAKKFVHRDLAARNCMVSSDHTVKIGDFGMTRDIYETDYYRKETRGLLPVRWMSPESLADGVFSAESDVWSYGIVLWEIATLAEQPYQGLANEQVLQFVIAKGTLERPLQCPDLLYDIMEACWKWRPFNRPMFTDIVEKLESHVGQDFKLVSFYHSREGEEFRMMKRELNKNKNLNAVTAMPGYSNRNISAHWTKEGDESTCYIGSTSRSVGPSSSYHSSNGFMSYPISSS